jgi:hypothetical protein
VNDVQALWADKWLCAATRREFEDRLQFVSASRARDRLWVGSYMRVVQSEPERRRSWLSHDRSLWWWASGGTSSAPACPQKCTAPIQMWLVLVRSPGGVVRRVLVGVLLELSSQLVTKRLPASLRLSPSDFCASLRPFCRIEPCLARVSQAKLRSFQSWGCAGVAFLVPSATAACLHGVWHRF